jgi:hypothetical protein
MRHDGHGGGEKVAWDGQNMTPKRAKAGMLGGYEAGKLRPEAFSNSLRLQPLAGRLKPRMKFHEVKKRTAEPQNIE